MVQTQLEARIYFNSFWVGVVKNGCYLLGYWTLKLAVFQE